MDPTQPPTIRQPAQAGDSGVEWDGEAATLRVGGEVDMSNAETVFNTSGVNGARSLTVDLTGVTFMDSSGLAMLIEVVKAVGESAANILVRAGSRVERLLEVSGLEDFLNVTLLDSDADT